MTSLRQTKKPVIRSKKLILFRSITGHFPRFYIETIFFSLSIYLFKSLKNMRARSGFFMFSLPTTARLHATLEWKSRARQNEINSRDRFSFSWENVENSQQKKCTKIEKQRKQTSV